MEQGLALVRYLASRQTAVRAISRHPPEASPFIEPFAADATDARSIAKALDGEFDTVFYTVDIHGLFKTAQGHPRGNVSGVRERNPHCGSGCGPRRDSCCCRSSDQIDRPGYGGS